MNCAYFGIDGYTATKNNSNFKLAIMLNNIVSSNKGILYN